MTERAFDPELLDVVAVLPTLVEWASAEEMPETRANMAGWSEPAEPRSDVVREDRLIPGREGDPDVAIRIYRPVDAGDTPLRLRARRAPPITYAVVRGHDRRGGGSTVDLLAQNKTRCVDTRSLRFLRCQVFRPTFGR